MFNFLYITFFPLIIFTVRHSFPNILFISSIHLLPVVLLSSTWPYRSFCNIHLTPWIWYGRSRGLNHSCCMFRQRSKSARSCLCFTTAYKCSISWFFTQGRWLQSALVEKESLTFRIPCADHLCWPSFAIHFTSLWFVNPCLAKISMYMITQINTCIKKLFRMQHSMHASTVTVILNDNLKQVISYLVVLRRRNIP